MEIRINIQSAIAGLAAGMLLAGGVAWASGPTDATGEQVCRTKAGYLRISSTGECRRSEVPVELPAGAQGEQGIQGEQGETGPQGIQGEQGVKGDVGEAGPLFPNAVILVPLHRTDIWLGTEWLYETLCPKGFIAVDTAVLAGRPAYRTDALTRSLEWGLCRYAP